MIGWWQSRLIKDQTQTNGISGYYGLKFAAQKSPSVQISAEPFSS